MKWAVGTLAIVGVVAGCGGSRGADTSAIRAALKTSHTTYLAYPSRTWGYQPALHTRIVVHGERATAIITGLRTLAEHARLEHRNGIWTVTWDDGGVINGSRVERPATRSELGAISAVAKRRDPRDVGCVMYAAHISTLDARYARVDYVFPKSQLRHPHGRCGLAVGNGADIYAHSAAGWRHLISGDEFFCGDAPPGVVRSLFGACLIPNLLH